MEQVQGFIRAVGQDIVNGNNEKLLLRGVGLGGWLLPEGYMWRFPEQGDRPRRMDDFIRRSAGDAYANLFWDRYYDHYIGEADIRKIKLEGFNSIRLPFSAMTLLTDEGYDAKILGYMDRMIDWCEEYKLYVILDMHSAPGGQTGTNIDDSRDDKPELFMDRANQEAMIEMWRFLAQRYKDRWIIAGYDLMNEPLPEWFNKYNHLVMPLYKEVIAAIREVDRDHMIILEGVHWATDWSIFYPSDSDAGLYMDETINGSTGDTGQSKKLCDDNLMLQFHKYWNNPDRESIQHFLDARDHFDLPLFMGEGGENNTAWYAGSFHMFEELNISWNFWTYKKMATDNSPCSVKMPVGWDKVTVYVEAGMTMDKEMLQHVLEAYLMNIQFDNCQYNQDVVDAMLRRAPVKVPAIFYDYMGEGNSFKMSLHYKDNIGFRVSDGTNLGFVNSDRDAVNFQHGGGEQWQEDERTMIMLKQGEWVNYSITVAEEGNYFLDMHTMSMEADSKMTIQIGNNETFDLTLDKGNWKIKKLAGKLLLGEGKQKVHVAVSSGSICLEWLQLKSTM